MDMNFASKGVGGTALGLSIGALGLEALRGGGGLLGGLFGNNSCGVNHYELSQQNEIANRDMEIAFLRGRDASKSDSLELYKYVDGRFRNVESQIAAQAVINAQLSASVSCMQNNIAVLNGLTKTVIPIGNICPLPATATTAATTAAATT